MSKDSCTPYQKVSAAGLQHMQEKRFAVFYYKFKVSWVESGESEIFILCSSKGSTDTSVDRLHNDADSFAHSSIIYREMNHTGLYTWHLGAAFLYTWIGHSKTISYSQIIMSVLYDTKPWLHANTISFYHQYFPQLKSNPSLYSLYRVKKIRKKYIDVLEY